MKKQDTYQNWEELVADLDFISWVKSGKDPAHEHWRHKFPVDIPEEWIPLATKAVNSLHFEDSEIDEGKKKEIWEAIDSSTPQLIAKQKIRSFNFGYLAIAASFLVLVVAGWIIWTLPGQQSFAVGLGEHLTVELPDESRVTVNSDSKIKYADGQWNDERVVELQGEAFFEVEKGNKFEVNTPYGQVEVLGTSFNVIAREDIFEVKCYTGKVRVSSNQQEFIILPGKIARLDNQDLDTTSFIPDTERAWMNGYFVFGNQPLAQVFKELERQFDVSIDDSQVDASQFYNGFFTDKDLDQALKAVCWPMRLKFEINNNRVTIFKEG